MKDDLLINFALQLERIKAKLKPKDTHAMGPKRPDLTSQETNKEEKEN